MSFVNLLPEDYVARQAQRRANLMCAVLFAAVMTGVLTAAVVSGQKHKNTQKVCERVDRSYNEAGKLIQQMQELDATKNKMLKKAKMTSNLLERVPRSYLLAMVTNALPKGASLTEFELTTKRQQDKSGSAKPKSRYKSASKKNKKEKATSDAPVKMKVSIVVTGLAETDVEVARFITTMASSPLMDNVDLIYSQEKEISDVVVREFQVILRLKLDADVIGAATKVGASGGLTGPAKRGNDEKETS